MPWLFHRRSGGCPCLQRVRMHGRRRPSRGGRLGPRQVRHGGLVANSTTHLPTDARRRRCDGRRGVCTLQHARRVRHIIQTSEHAKARALLHPFTGVCRTGVPPPAPPQCYTPPHLLYHRLPLRSWRLPAVSSLCRVVGGTAMCGASCCGCVRALTIPAHIGGLPNNHAHDAASTQHTRGM